ncbi:hypothetical protein M422DRAFT_773393 [Sphaerobolus stellatus SS14]|nr:hypothetical protein M422DRAFT_773393 [Sphaerobolus stellatus SS14]
MSSSSSRTSSIVTIAAVTTVAAIVGYAVYFDHKRRNDIEFRKSLRKQQKKVHKTVSKEKSRTAITPEDIREAYRAVKSEAFPMSVPELEQYFQETVAIGEKLVAKGEQEYLNAAKAFFRALLVFPNQMDLMRIYQGMLPEPVLNILLELWALELKNQGEAYYHHFPPRDMNVLVATVPVRPGDESLKKRVLVAAKDFEEGEFIYKEDPVVAALFPQLETLKAHCSHCLRRLTDRPLEFYDDPFGSAYCSQTCQLTVNSEYRDLLFSPSFNTIHPTQSELSTSDKESRKEAQRKIVSIYQKGPLSPLLVAHFIGKQVQVEIARLGLVDAKPTAKVDDSYTLNDHMEQLRYMEVPFQQEEYRAIFELLRTGMPGLESSLSDERYGMLKGKMTYNAIGIHDDNDYREQILERTAQVEWARSSAGSSQKGSGLYKVSSYLSHSCNPNVYLTFPDGTFTLHLMAKKPIKAGEELNMAYVDVSQREGEPLQVARLRRRTALAAGWGIVCTCKRCVEEAPTSQENKPSELPESRIETDKPASST